MLAAGFVLLALLLAGAYLLADVREQGIRQEQKAEAVRHTLTEVLLVIEGAETAQRGYLLTGQAVYLAPYRAARSSLQAALGELDAQVSSPQARERLTELRGLVAAKQAEIEQTLALYHGGRQQAAVELVRSNVGMDLMQRIRRVVRAMQADCDRRIEVARAKGRVLSDWLLAGVSVISLAILGLATLSLREISRRHRMIVRTRDELLASNEALKASVRQQAMLEEAVRQSRKMEALGALTGGLAHDFNNMLAVVIGNLELMRMRLAKGGTDLQRYIDYALEGAQRAGELTRRLLAFARKQPLRPVLVSLNEAVAGITEMIRRTLGGIYTIELVQAGGLWPVVVDVNQLENALVNLAVNARDAMPEGGRLTIQTANVALDEDYASRHPDVGSGPYVMIAVTDTGHGMSEDVLAKAFDPFFTTKEVGKGTGLGLSQVYGFVKQSGGHVDIASEPKKGTTVRIYLPRAPEGSLQAPMPAPAAEADALPRGDSATTILLVEDDPSVRIFAAEALTELGYSVLTAPSGHRALANLEANPQVALLLTDVVMAEMTGRQLAELALRLQPQLRVLYMTGFTREALDRGGVMEPGVALLRKPFTLDELAHRVHAVLAGAPPAGGARADPSHG
ncbi:CHASE3 domain-containing protein [Fulvimonas yonginensis]|uniref:histidine kinase n=1 Tax=Fulvimonas yonginensis TaxID=1495200 RepID=A0ABU8J7W5_9GAMM